MTGNRVAARRAANTNKALALGAAGLVLAGGVTAGSLAAWPTSSGSPVASARRPG